jgi:hypothetical protein
MQIIGAATARCGEGRGLMIALIGCLLLIVLGVAVEMVVAVLRVYRTYPLRGGARDVSRP